MMAALACSILSLICCLILCFLVSGALCCCRLFFLLCCFLGFTSPVKNNNKLNMKWGNVSHIQGLLVVQQLLETKKSKK